MTVFWVPWVFAIIALAVVGFALAMLLPSTPPSPHTHPTGRHRRRKTMTVAEKTMYERLGIDAVRTAVEQFYVRCFADPNLDWWFGGLSLEARARLQRHQVLLFSQVLGGPVSYTVDELSAAHRHLVPPPSNEAYAAVVGHLLGVLYYLAVPGDIIKHLLVTLEDVRPLIVADPAGVAVLAEVQASAPAPGPAGSSAS